LRASIAYSIARCRIAAFSNFNHRRIADLPRCRITNVSALPGEQQQ
jgi:hypothetical protein